MDDDEIYVGIDWATDEHQVCVVGPRGQVLERFKVAHTGDGLAKLVDRVRAHEAVHVFAGIERPDGAVVDALLDAGVTVLSINPKQVDRFRDRHSVAGAKSDALDAFVIADALRNDRRVFRQITPLTEQRLALRELARMHEEVEGDLARARNQLYAQLLRYFPQILELSPAASDPWVWRVLKKAPTPATAAKLRPHVVEQILKACRIRKWTAEQVIEVLRKPALPVSPGLPAAASMHVRVLVDRLELLHGQSRHIDRQMTKLLDDVTEESEPGQHEHRDVAILRSLPGVGVIVAVTVLAEARQALANRDYRNLRVVAGVAPVTSSTGKQERRQNRTRKGRNAPFVRMRRACNARLKYALFHWAKAAVQNNAHFASKYAAYRSRGIGQGGALRRIGDQLLRMLCAALKSGTLYDPGRLAA